MGEAAATRAFLIGEVDALAAFDFLAVRPSGRLLHTLEIARREDASLEVRVPGRPPAVEQLPVAQRAQLRDLGFASEDASDPLKPWKADVGGAEAGVDKAMRVLTEVFAEKPDAPLDVVHGSHRHEHEARVKLKAARERVEKVLAKLLGEKPTQDADGDYVLPMADVHVMVAPRAVPGGPVVVRVFAITNVGVNVAAELGLFLARLNFGLMFGRFALDTEHRAIWFDETLLGDQFSDEELRFAIDVVASTADEWDDRLKQFFGGATYQEVLKGRSDQKAPTNKPGEGGYL